MQQTFVIDVAASICPPLTEQEVQDAIARVMFEKESRLGMGSMMIEVEQTFGTTPLQPYGWISEMYREGLQ